MQPRKAIGLQHRAPEKLSASFWGHGVTALVRNEADKPPLHETPTERRETARGRDETAAPSGCSLADPKEKAVKEAIVERFICHHQFPRL